MTDNIPQHVAIIPDGNRRWAKQRGLLALYGHNHGAEIMHHTVKHLIARGIKYLTVWGFSVDNWKRSDAEVNDLLHLLAAWIELGCKWFLKPHYYAGTRHARSPQNYLEQHKR